MAQNKQVKTQAPAAPAGQAAPMPAFPQADSFTLRVSNKGAILLSVVFLAVAVALYLALGERAAAAVQAPDAGSTGLRQYYLTGSTVTGGEADTACYSGYHMASLWEIWDTSNLQYNLDFGTAPQGSDIGSGPPASLEGWVRTGYLPVEVANGGQANCNGWFSSQIWDNGSTVFLNTGWLTGATWRADEDTCDYLNRVWCVED